MASRLLRLGLIVGGLGMLSWYLTIPAAAQRPYRYYYVLPHEALLRECPLYDCPVVAVLYRGDKVEFLDSNNVGWWKMRSLRTGAIGWLPADLVTLEPQPYQPVEPPVYFYVTANSLPLRVYPLYSSGVVGTVYLNERVEKLGDSPQGWVKVRSLRDGSSGWVPARFLATAPTPYAKPRYTPKKRVKKPAVEEAPAPADKQPEAEKAKPM